MSPSRAVLRQPESYPESRLPPGVQPLPRPPALGRAVELAFLRWEKRRLGADRALLARLRHAHRQRVARARGGRAARRCAVHRDRRAGAARPLRRPGVPDVRRHRPRPLRRAARGALACARVDPRWWARHRAVRPVRDAASGCCRVSARSNAAAVARAAGRRPPTRAATGAARQSHGARADRAGARRAARATWFCRRWTSRAWPTGTCGFSA